MQKGGNAKAILYWEAKLPKHFKKPTESEQGYVVEKWIRDKYEKKLYVSRLVSIYMIHNHVHELIAYICFDLIIIPVFYYF